MHRWICMLLALVVCMTAPLTAYAGEKKLTPEERFAPQQTQPLYVEVPGRGDMRYYAQNDDLWRRVFYESDKSKKIRPFGDGGCGPTSLAIIVANMIPADQLDAILDYTERPVSLCEHHINSTKCKFNRCRERFELNTSERIERFLPLVMADFALGNNTFDVISRTEDRGTGTGFIPYVARVYGLTITTVNQFSEVEPLLREGKLVMAHCSAGGAFSKGGHYIVLVHVDDEKLYVLDPYIRKKYDSDYGRKVERISPGLVALSLDDIGYAYFSRFMVFDYAEVTDEAPAETPAETGAAQ